MRFYWLRRAERPRYSGGYDDEHKWGLPGVHCPVCHLGPGTKFGPLVGAARGEFGPLCLHNPWTLLMRPEPLERLTAEGVRGLKGCRTELRFRTKNPPELLELEVLPHGRVHPDCLPVDRLPPVANVAGSAGSSRRTPSWMQPPFRATWTCSGWETS